MVKLFKMIVICAIGSMAVSSCLGDKESQIYTEVYSVIKSNMGVMFFSSDDGIDLYPAGGFESKWGKEGDRIVVGFHYNPYTITENTTRMDVTVEALYAVQTDYSALPSSVDTVGSGAFFLESGSDQAVAAWAAQNYLTARFSVRYSDATKHTFGFIEEPTLFQNDTLFLSLWHNAKEEGKNAIAVSHIALNLSDYSGYLSIRDSTVISIRYKAESSSSPEAERYTCNLMYRKQYNSSGF